MKVEVNSERKYHIRWKRIRREGKIKSKNNKNKKIKLTDTECIISFISDNKELSDKYIFVSGGKAFQNPIDNYSKAIGRKISLTRALKYFDGKEERKKFWEKYIEECRLV